MEQRALADVAELRAGGALRVRAGAMARPRRVQSQEDPIADTLAEESAPFLAGEFEVDESRARRQGMLRHLGWRLRV